MIDVEPMAGLANRMRVINSAYWLARDLGKDLRVIWTPYRGLNCAFSNLFKDPAEFSVKERKKDIFHETRLFDLYFSARSVGYSKAIKLIRKKTIDLDLFSDLRGRKRILIASVHQFYAPDKPFYRFEPLDQINDRIAALTGKYSRYTVGVHIRRADHKISTNTSTTEKFIGIMNEILMAHPEATFFLATDNPEEERGLRKEFGTRILSAGKELSRNSQQGIADALVDLYCLSKTRKVIGSYFSSFSEVAARLQGIPLDIVT
jgi:hypothetical protein